MTLRMERNFASRLNTTTSRRSLWFALAGAAMAAPALRVASLDWALAETMIALGQPPIALVAASDWNRFVVEPELPAGVVDLGLQQEINFELLSALKPDLILTSPFLENLEPALKKIARTLRLSINEKGAEPLAQPRLLTATLGQRLGRAQAAQAYLAEAESRLDGYRRRLEGRAVNPLLLVSFIDPRHVRVYGGAGLYQNVLDRIGIRNAWSGQTNYWGYATVGIEKLAVAKDARLMVFDPVPPDALRTLRQSPLWTHLPFVRAGRVSHLPTTFMFGAMPAALRFARVVVEELERTLA